MTHANGHRSNPHSKGTTPQEVIDNPCPACKGSRIQLQPNPRNPRGFIEVSCRFCGGTGKKEQA